MLISLTSIRSAPLIALFWFFLSGGLPAHAETSGALNLMPVPASVTETAGKLRLEKTFSVSLREKEGARLEASATRFLRRLDGRVGMFFSNPVPQQNNPRATLIIETERPGRLQLGEDESYSLTVQDHQIKLSAPTDLGAMHGLETLLQLLSADEQGYYFPAVRIHDQPRFPWRGLMLDVARHFLPMDVIKHNIDGMAAVKLNVLHLHLTDNQGFRIESKVFPKLQQTSGEYFTQTQIREIVAYAGERGIRVVPEFDLPAHATALLAAYPELGSKPGPYVLEPMFGIFDPVLDPTRDENYRFLETLFAELLPLFPDQYVHIGGDENARGTDWHESASIQAFMKGRDIRDNHALQAYFNQRLLKILSGMNRKMIGWEEILHPDLPKDAAVQIWIGKASLFRAAHAGYSALLSDGFYIDLMHPASEHYLVDPVFPEGKDLSKADLQRILGGEATMWTELTSAQNVDSRIWPRTAAIAERLWSKAEVRDVDDMYRRLDITSVRLEELGLTHLTSRQVIMRNLAGGTTNTHALEVLIDVIEPLKDYSRNTNDTRYSVTSPLTLIADAANADARGARLFRKGVERYLADHSRENLENLRASLDLWVGNDAEIQKLIRISPNLKEIAVLSANLKHVSQIALSVLDNRVTVDAEYFHQFEAGLKSMRLPGGQTTLQVIDPIEKLVRQRYQENGGAP